MIIMYLGNFFVLIFSSRFFQRLECYPLPTAVRPFSLFVNAFTVISFLVSISDLWLLPN